MINWIFKKRLARLLEDNSIDTVPFFSRCQTFFSKSGLRGYTCSGKVARKEVIEIYRQRSNLPERTRSITGYKEVLHALEIYQEQYLRIHSFGDDLTTFIIFTDSKVCVVVGVLVSTKL